MSVEAYIPYDLRERLAEQIKVIDKMMTDAVIAERERCIGICRYVLREDLAGLCIGHIESGKPLAAIRKGKLDTLAAKYPYLVLDASTELAIASLLREAGTPDLILNRAHVAIRAILQDAKTEIPPEVDAVAAERERCAKLPPWRPMSEAPRDGTDIVAIYNDLSGTAVIFWGETVDPPHDPGWFNYTSDAGDIENSSFWGPDDDVWYGWVPYAKGW